MVSKLVIDDGRESEFFKCAKNCDWKKVITPSRIRWAVDDFGGYESSRLYVIFSALLQEEGDFS